MSCLGGADFESEVSTAISPQNAQGQPQACPALGGLCSKVSILNLNLVPQAAPVQCQACPSFTGLCQGGEYFGSVWCLQNLTTFLTPRKKCITQVPRARSHPCLPQEDLEISRYAYRYFKLGLVTVNGANALIFGSYCSSSARLSLPYCPVTICWQVPFLYGTEVYVTGIYLVKNGTFLWDWCEWVQMQTSNILHYCLFHL